MEEHAKTRAGWNAGAAVGRGASAGGRGGRAVGSRADPAARRICAIAGAITAAGVRGEEGAAARTHVSGAAGSRVVSLVPSASETLVALGVPAVACTRFCELAGVPTVGGTKNPDVAAIVALAPDLVVVNDEENRWEDATAFIDAGIAVHSMSPRSVHDVGAEVRALAERVSTSPRSVAVRRRRVGRVARVGALAALVRRVRRGLAAALDVAGERHLRLVAARRARCRATCSPTPASDIRR